MDTINTIIIESDVNTVFQLAADVLRWPKILPHYRWVTISQNEQGQIITEMAAWRDFVPVWWRSIQQVNNDTHTVSYQHIAGITKGMEVEWSVQQEDKVVRATILHHWNPPWTLPGAIRQPLGQVIGELFVKVVADRTLRGIKRQAELAQPVSVANHTGGSYDTT